MNRPDMLQNAAPVGRRRSRRTAELAGHLSGWVRRYAVATRLGAPYAVALLLLLMGAATPVAAERFQVAHAGDGVVGRAFYVRARHRDTLLDIGRHNGVGYDEMKHANPNVDMWVPGESSDVLVPTQFVLPNAPRRGVVLNLAEKRLYYFPPAGDSETPSVESYAISIGREGWNTPTGSFSIARKDKDPAWYPPASIRAEHAADGRPLPEVVPAGPDNPLGQHALRLSAAGYLIHGTNKPWGVGMQVSHGCIRMYPEDIAHLFPEVEVGTPVTIVDQPYKFGWLGDELYMEVHAPEDAPTPTLGAIVPEELANADGVAIDWNEVRRAVAANTGLPQVVGSRSQAGNWLYLDMIF